MFWSETLVVCLLIIESAITVPQRRNSGSNNQRQSDAYFAFPDEFDYDYGRPHYGQNHHHHHYHHQHDPQLFESPEYNPVVNPTSRRDLEEKQQASTGGNSTFAQKGESQNKTGQIPVPVEFVLDLNKYTVNDLLANYVDGFKEEDPLIQDRFGGDESERGGSSMPEAAGCMPELTKIKIGNTTDPSILYIPQCTRVERCGGCCTHALLSCQPTEKGVETVTYSVIKTQYVGGKRLKYLGKEPISIEKHTKCRCACKVKETDCTKYQEYRQNECRCMCKNIDEQTKCYKNNHTKLWDPNMCACRCRHILQCSTGSYYDPNDCKCIPLPTTVRREINSGRRGYKSGAKTVIPLDDDSD